MSQQMQPRNKVFAQSQLIQVLQGINTFRTQSFFHDITQTGVTTITSDQEAAINVGTSATIYKLGNIRTVGVITARGGLVLNDSTDRSSNGGLIVGTAGVGVGTIQQMVQLHLLESSLLVVVSILVFNLLVLLLRRTLVSIHLTLLDLVTQSPTLLQQTLLMSVSQDRVEVEVVSQRHQRQFHPQVQQAQVVLKKRLNDLHQCLLRLHKVQTIKLVDILSYMTVRLLLRLRNQQSQPDQC